MPQHLWLIDNVVQQKGTQHCNNVERWDGERRGREAQKGGDIPFERLPYQLSMVVAVPTMVTTGDGESGFDSGGQVSSGQGRKLRWKISLQPHLEQGQTPPVEKSHGTGHCFFLSYRWELAVPEPPP